MRIVGDPGGYARSFDLASVSRPTYDDEHHFRGADDDTVAYVLTLDAVNFGSGWFPRLRKRPGMSGYFTIASRLTDRFRRHGPFEAAELAGMHADRVAEVFDQPLDDPTVAELMDLFADAWRQLGEFVGDAFDGRFTGLVEAAHGSAEALVATLARMPAFRDVATYGGREVPFYKRAQITASDLALAFEGRGYGHFDDIDELTIFADNLVPHVLRVDGVIAYDAELEERIASGELLEAGSPEEVEIRAVAVETVERMAAALRADGWAVSPRELDVALWNRGQEERYRSAPRHRTRTVWY